MAILSICGLVPVHLVYGISKSMAECGVLLYKCSATPAARPQNVEGNPLSAKRDLVLTSRVLLNLSITPLCAEISSSDSLCSTPYSRNSLFTASDVNSVLLSVQKFLIYP